MARRTDIESILIFGSGPIVIGQACEFDYSGTQACRVLRREGYRVILVNSNPATIMTDPEFADATYVEPLVPEIAERIIERERPDALLPTVGGQTGINLTLALSESGVLEDSGMTLLGASVEALRLGEDRQLFKRAMVEAGLEVPESGTATTLKEAREIIERLGFPVIVRPSFTLGGEGGGVVFNRDEIDDVITRALQASPASRILLEQSVLGWKEFELEVMRDVADNAIVVCSVENVDPMGVHTGDSITVAPQMTLSDAEYQDMRDDAFTVIRKVGVATGGSNIQFAVEPGTGRRVVIEMNPRVSRSSAWLPRRPAFRSPRSRLNWRWGTPWTRSPTTSPARPSAAFEPTLDYTVVKIPRWAFEKFEPRRRHLGHVDEVGGRGDGDRRQLPRGADEGPERLGAGRRVAAAGRAGQRSGQSCAGGSAPRTGSGCSRSSPALRQGWTVEEVAAASSIDPWFLREIESIIECEAELACWDLDSVPDPLLRRAR